MDDAKVSRTLKKLIKQLERKAQQEFGERMGVGLILFPFGDEENPNGIVNYQYISNCPRAHMQGALKALVAKWEGGHVDVPLHEEKP